MKTLLLALIAGLTAISGTYCEQTAQTKQNDSTPSVILTVDKIKVPAAPVYFSFCRTKSCHNLGDKPGGYTDFLAEQVELIEDNGQTKKYKITGLKPGEYSISGYQDLNGNNTLDTKALFGNPVPLEPVGFSRLNTVRLTSNPKWTKISFTLGADPVNLTFHLIHKCGL